MAVTSCRCCGSLLLTLVSTLAMGISKPMHMSGSNVLGDAFSQGACRKNHGVVRARIVRRPAFTSANLGLWRNLFARIASPQKLFFLQFRLRLAKKTRVLTKNMGSCFESSAGVGRNPLPVRCRALAQYPCFQGLYLTLQD